LLNNEAPVSSALTEFADSIARIGMFIMNIDNSIISSVRNSLEEGNLDEESFGVFRQLREMTHIACEKAKEVERVDEPHIVALAEVFNLMVRETMLSTKNLDSMTEDIGHLLELYGMMAVGSIMYMLPNNEE